MPGMGPAFFYSRFMLHEAKYPPRESAMQNAMQTLKDNMPEEVYTK
jgi:hypothetical protein